MRSIHNPDTIGSMRLSVNSYFDPLSLGIRHASHCLLCAAPFYHVSHAATLQYDFNFIAVRRGGRPTRSLSTPQPCNCLFGAQSYARLLSL